MSGVPYHELVGISVAIVEPGRARARLGLDARKTNKRGVAHGGATASLLDAAMGAALVSSIPKEWWCATKSLQVDFIAPGRGEELVAEGRVEAREGSHAEVVGTVRDSTGRIVARATGTFRVWEHHPDAPRDGR